MKTALSDDLWEKLTSMFPSSEGVKKFTRSTFDMLRKSIPFQSMNGTMKDWLGASFNDNFHQTGYMGMPLLS